MKAIDLINSLPADTKEKVEDAWKKYNLFLRETIRSETRLSLYSGRDNGVPEKRDKQTTTKIPIKMDIAYPRQLEALEIPEEFKLAALLSPIRPDLIKLKESAGEVISFIVEYQDNPHILNYCGGAICYAGDEANELLNITEHYDFAKEILQIDNNILGHYRFTPKSMYEENFSSGEASISLYWGVIGLIAKTLGVDIHALTAVVLAHELAHAYTHLGYDINGHRWNDESWRFSEPALIEGLAQYYTERTMFKLQQMIPRGYEAYLKLLEKQPRDYQTHKRWITQMKADPEAIRLTLISLRRGAPIELPHFDDVLQRNIYTVQRGGNEDSLKSFS